MGLLEVMLAITIATALLSVVALAISRIFAENTVARQHTHTMNALGQLGSQLRRDVHAAVAATPDPAGETTQRLELTMPGKDSVKYQIIPDGIERRQYADGVLRSKELFLLEGMRPIAWRVDNDQRDVALTIGRLAHRTRDRSPASALADVSETLNGEFTIRAVRRGAGRNLNP
jgi:type II secretory pathway pseudopilin PulG